MTKLVIRITAETAIYLLKDIIRTYQDVDGNYSKVRTYLMYLIFLVKAKENGWRSVDESLAITAILLAPLDMEARERGEMFLCRVGYYRSGIKNIDTFSFPVDKYWAKMLYENFTAIRGRLKDSPFDPIELRAAQDTEHLIDIEDMVLRNYGDYT